MTDDLITWLRERLDEDEAWARAASKPYAHAMPGTTSPERGTHWRWVAGDDWHTVSVDPVTDQYVAENEDGLMVWLATVEEWPSRSYGLDWDGQPGRSMPWTSGAIEEMDACVGAFIARNDPARALAEVAAKRWLLTEIAIELADDDSQEMVNERLRRLAEPYADQPGYRDEWRPDPRNNLGR